MKKIIIFLCLLLLPIYINAEINKEILSETTCTVNTTPSTKDIPTNGYVEVSTQGNLFITFLGTTSNMTSKRKLSANSSIDTEMFFFTNDSIGVQAESGTVTYNISVYRKR